MTLNVPRHPSHSYDVISRLYSFIHGMIAVVAFVLMTVTVNQLAVGSALRTQPPDIIYESSNCEVLSFGGYRTHLHCTTSRPHRAVSIYVDWVFETSQVCISANMPFNQTRTALIKYRVDEKAVKNERWRIWKGQKRLCRSDTDIEFAISFVRGLQGARRIVVSVPGRLFTVSVHDMESALSAAVQL